MGLNDWRDHNEKEMLIWEDSDQRPRAEKGGQKKILRFEE